MSKFKLSAKNDAIAKLNGLRGALLFMKSVDFIDEAPYKAIDKALADVLKEVYKINDSRMCNCDEIKQIGNG